MKSIINRVTDALSSITNGSILGQISIATGAILSSFFIPIIPVILTCFGLTFIDLFYGISIAKKKKSVESRRMWNGTIKKLYDTFAIITMTRGIELYLLAGIGGTILTGAVATIIGLTEMWSILENMNTLNPDGPWRAIGRYMKKKGEEVIGMDLDLKYNENNKVDKGQDPITN